MESPNENARITRAFAAQQSYGDPSRDMRIVGVTGTNGKTTTVFLVASIMNTTGVRSQALGTINSPLTTLGEPELAQKLAQLRDEGIQVVAMEVSSHGLAQHRVDAVHFDVTAFSNLTQDHLDYHTDMNDYFAAKKRLFFDLDSEASVINIESDAGRELAEKIAAVRPDRKLITVGASDARVFASHVEESVSGTSFTLTIDGDEYPVDLPLVGYHNVSNALLAAGCSFALGVAGVDIADGLAQAEQVAGRLQRIATEHPINVFVDYAHTPDALAHALGSLRDVTDGELIVVFGCGGDRDTTKRPLMGKVAADGADHIIVTTDNPRSEDPRAIIDDIVAGMDGTSADAYSCEVDRASAIDRAIDHAQAGDTILIAGKGHETYQIFADETIDFDDTQVAREALGRVSRNRE